METLRITETEIKREVSLTRAAARRHGCKVTGWHLQIVDGLVTLVVEIRHTKYGIKDTINTALAGPGVVA